MSIINNMPNNTGAEIQGVLEEYYVYAGQKVSVRDAVEFINGVAARENKGTTEYYHKAYNNNNPPQNITALALSEDRILITGHTNSYTVYGAVAIISGNSFSLGTQVTISTGDYGRGSFAIGKVAENKYIAGYYYKSSSSTSTLRTRGKLLTIVGTTISVGTEAILWSEECYSNLSFCEHTPELCVMMGNYNADYTRVASITVNNNNTISLTNNLTLFSDSSQYHCVVPVSDNKFLTTCKYSNSGYAKLVQLTGTAFSLLSTYQFSSSCNTISNIVMLNNNIAFLIYTESSTPYGLLLRINENSVTLYSKTSLSGITGNFVLKKISDKKVLAVSSGGTCLILDINGTAVTKHTAYSWLDTGVTQINEFDVAISNIYINATTFLINYACFYVDRDRYEWRLKLLGVDNDNISNTVITENIETQVRGITGQKFDGVAKTSGEGGTQAAHKDKVQIYTKHLNYEKPTVIKHATQRDKTFTGNIFPTVWSTTVTTNTKYKSDDGYILTADSASTVATNACDGSSTTYWRSATNAGGTDTGYEIQISCPTAVKITKMNTRITANNTSYFKEAYIFGSHNGSHWISIAHITSFQSAVTEVALYNTDYYKYYKLDITVAPGGSADVYEWQTSEYQMPYDSYTYNLDLPWFRYENGQKVKLQAISFYENTPWQKCNLTINSQYIQLNDVAWGAKGYIAVGTSGEIVRSTDGLNWTQVNSGTTKWLHRVICTSRGRYIVLGNETILISDDGINWTKKESGITTGSPLFYDIAYDYDNGCYTIVCAENSTVTSTDEGETWIPHDAAFDNGYYMHSICYGKGQYVMIDPGTTTKAAKILTSTDGINWTEHSLNIEIPKLHEINCIRYFNNQFWAVGYAGLIMKSDDGITWEKVNLNITQTINSIDYGNGYYIIGSYRNNYASTDGRIWVPQQLSLNGDIMSVKAGNNRFVAAGAGGLATTTQLNYVDNILPYPFLNINNMGEVEINSEIIGGRNYDLIYSNGIWEIAGGGL